MCWAVHFSDVGGWQAANESMTSLNISAPNDTVERLVTGQSAGFPNVASNDMEVDEIMGFSSAAPDDTTEQLLASEFIISPSQETLNGIVSDFIDATSNNALKTLACGSCARETNINECDEMPIKNIPNKHPLIPHTAHAAHELVDGLLIYAPALGVSKKTVYICNECRNQLKRDVRSRLSLSNDMWIGDTPRELQNLTLPECILLAKYFPTAYIVKMFPKQKNAFTWDHSQMHSGLKGNVSTY